MGMIDVRVWVHRVGGDEESKDESRYNDNAGKWMREKETMESKQRKKSKVAVHARLEASLFTIPFVRERQRMGRGPFLTLVATRPPRSSRVPSSFG